MLRALPSFWALLSVLPFCAIAPACDLVIPPAYDLASPGHAEAPAGGPEAACVRDCAARAKACSRHECIRGCNLVLDRLVESEGLALVACVAKRAACDDRAWAHCAVRVGPYVDGGPPAPAPPSTDEPEDEAP